MVAMVTVFCNPRHHTRVDEIISMDDRLSFTVGYHPKYLMMDGVSLSDEEQILKHDRCVGFGEIGLDFVHAVQPEQRAIQESAFIHLLRFFRDTGLTKPIVLHLRNDNQSGIQSVYRRALRILRDLNLHN